MLGLSCVYEHDRQNGDYVVQCWGALRGRSEKAVELEQKRAVENFIYILMYRFVKEETLLGSWLHVNRVTCCWNPGEQDHVDGTTRSLRDARIHTEARPAN